MTAPTKGIRKRRLSEMSPEDRERRREYQRAYKAARRAVENIGKPNYQPQAFLLSGEVESYEVTAKDREGMTTDELSAIIMQDLDPIADKKDRDFWAAVWLSAILEELVSRGVQVRVRMPPPGADRVTGWKPFWRRVSTLALLELERSLRRRGKA